MLNIKNVNLTFNKSTPNERKALVDFNLHLKKGDFMTVIGSNGAGKSTLLNAISGSYRVDSGEIIIDGTNVTKLPEHKRAKFIGRLFQDPLRGTAPSMTIEENLGLANSRGKYRSLSIGIKKSDAEFFKDKLRELDLGLEDRLKTPVGLLSGGQRQAITLMMATIVTPSILLLDEHTAALDPKTADKVMEITKKIIEEHKITTLMITHNVQNALDYGNKTVVLSGGRARFEFEGVERENMTIQKLLTMYSNTGDTVSDSMILE